MSNYKIIRVAGLHYSTLIKSFYQHDLTLKQKPYDEQQKALFHQANAYGNSFSQGMRVLGHDAHELVYDLEPMQKRWAEEFGISFRSSYWQWDILLAQIEKMRPDILFFQDLHALPFSLRKSLKSRFPFLKLVVIFRGYPGTSKNLFKDLAAADVLLVGSPILFEKCCKARLHPHLVYHYFDESILRKISPSPMKMKRYNFTFAGSSGYGYGLNYELRYRALVDLLKKTPLEVWIDEGGQENFRSTQQMIVDESKKIVKRCLSLCPNSTLQQLCKIPLPLSVQTIIHKIINEKNLSHHFQPLQILFPSQCHRGVFGLEMYQLLSDSKLTFNIHSSPAAGSVDNIRLFQATGVGTCLLTDWGSNMHQLFEADSEIVTYRSIDECIEKTSFLLRHDEIRQTIGQAGQNRTLKNHTSIQRLRQMDEIFQKALN